MKKHISILLATVALASSADARLVCGGAPAPAPNISVPTFNRGGAVFYQDLLNRCQSFVTGLVGAKNTAQLLSRTTNLGRAADILKNAIKQNAAQLPPPFSAEVYPHTVESIRVAGMIVDEIEKGVSDKLNVLGKVLIDQVRYNAYVNAIRMVEFAHNDLDVYFMQSFNSCYHGCNDFQGVPAQYYQGMKRLALGYLEFIKQMDQFMAHTEIELLVSRTAVNAAKTTIARSMSRRELACIVTELHDLENAINSQLCGELSGIWAPWQEGFTRGWIETVIGHINSTMNVRGCSRSRQNFSYNDGSHSGAYIGGSPGSNGSGYGYNQVEQQQIPQFINRNVPAAKPVLGTEPSYGNYNPNWGN